MNVKKSLFLFSGAFLFMYFSSCVKDTLDLDTFSEEAELSPSVALKIAKGSFSIENAFSPTDTFVFNDDRTISIVYREDSVISYDVNELLDIAEVLPDDGPEIRDYTLDNLTLGAFSDTESLTLDEISNNFTEPAKTAVRSLFGTTSPFPAINPPIGGGTHSFDPFGNFTVVTIASGLISLGVTNNLSVEIGVLTVRVFDSGAHEAGIITFNNIPANGGTASQNIDLAGKTLTNQLSAEITAIGTPGSVTPVPINSTDNIQLQVSSSGLEISGGTAIIPTQLFNSENTNIDLDLTGGEEVYEIKMRTAAISYTVSSTIHEDVKVVISLPATTLGGNPVSFERIISYNGGVPETGTFSLDRSITDLTTDPLQPYNLIPFEYALNIESSNNQFTFTSGDNLHLEVEVTGIQFEYAEGKLGTRVETIETDTFEIEDEFLDRFSGSLQLADPKVKVVYQNSFGLPIQLDLDVVGKFKDASTVNLNASPTALAYPSDTLNLVKKDSVVFDKDNTDIEDLLVFPPPREIIYSGSANINYLGSPPSVNFVSYRSRIDADIEVEIPLDFSASDLALQDTLDVEIDTTDFDPENLKFSKIYVNSQNWFPFDLEFTLTPYDSISLVTIGEPLVFSLLTAADVNTQTGIVEKAKRSNQEIDITSEFFRNLSKANQLIVKVGFETSGGGTTPVKILTTYSVDFQIGVQAEFNYPLNGN